MKKNVRILLLLSGIIVVLLGTLSLKEDESRFQISKSLDIFARLFREVNSFYVDEMNPEEMVENGINAMLRNLDPYTVYYPESKIDEFNMMTTGEYAGIGSVISLKGDYVMIREPYTGSPAHKAGLLPGDLILSIDGEDMKGKKVDEVSSRLKGVPGKEMTLRLQRIGEEKPIEKKIIREVVALPSVPYYGMLDGNVGYIFFTSFTDKSAADVRKAIVELKNKGAESLVIDLRSNGGGLLDQAVEISNFFLPKGSLVVSTKGKMKQWDKEHYATRNPLEPDMKLAILIDRASASAAEILSGAIQDYDRGVVIGQRSFGKGLVQTTRNLAYNTKLKVTTAKYYIPSGRCIQALDYSHRNPDGSVGTVPDSLINPFLTKAGRTVYDGGGIKPDIEIEPRKYARITQELVIQDMMFDFVNEYAAKHPTIAELGLFYITDQMYDEFKAFLKTKEFKYETASEEVLEKLVATAKEEKYYELITPEIEKLKANFSHSIDRDLDVFKDEISNLLADQFIERYYMREGTIEYNTRFDPEVLKALEVLGNTKSYSQVLAGI